MSRSLRVLILAAGESRRLRDIASGTPKPMVTVLGKPPLQWNIELLRDAGVSEVFINLHYRLDAITRCFGDGSSFGVRIRYLHEARLLGSAGTVRNAAPTLRGGDFLVVYGDNISTIDLRKLVRCHRENSADATVALFRRADTGASGVADVREDGRITGFCERPQVESPTGGWVNAGYLVFAPSVLDMIPAADKPLDIGSDLLPLLIASGKRVYGYRMTEGLWWIDTPEDYRRTLREFKGGSRS